MNSEIARLTPEEGTVPVAPAHLARLADLSGEGKLNSSMCKEVLSILFKEDQDPDALIAKGGFEQVSDEELLRSMAKEVVASSEKILADYRSGNKKAFQALVGQMMKRTKGKGNPALIQKLLKEEIGE